jgi:GAF domain-containing protein
MGDQLLCVDPQEATRDETTQRLESELADFQLTITSCETLQEAKAALSADVVAVITEYDLPGGTAFDLIRAAEDVCPDAGYIVYTDVDPDTIDTAPLQGSLTEYVGKGSVFGAERLTELVRTTIETRGQASYPQPQDETERVAALRSYELDSPGLRTSLDRLTELAATHFEVETASINIIEEHSQEYLACHGAAEDWELTDREDSICTFTILEEDTVMVVEDVTEDPRFASRSDSFIEMGIRAYMGAQLVTPAGLVIGSFCVYDTAPRSFTEENKAYLSDLAATAIDFIELYTHLKSSVANTEGDR